MSKGQPPKSEMHAFNCGKIIGYISRIANRSNHEDFASFFNFLKENPDKVIDMVDVFDLWECTKPRSSHGRCKDDDNKH